MNTQITLPRITSYNPVSTSANYGLNSLMVEFPNVTLYFSYQTLVAFRANGRLMVSQNDWGTTTGKHLNWIDGGNKAARLPRAEFEKQYQAMFGQLVSL